MQLLRRAIPTLLLLLSSMAWGGELNETERELSIGVGLDFASGGYGSETTTRFVAVPLLLQYTPTPRLTLAMNLPWIYQDNSATTYGSSTGPSHGQMAGTKEGGAPGGVVLSASAGQHHGRGEGGAETLDPDKAQSGLGDATLTAAYNLTAGGGWSPRLDALLYLKIPLADEEKGIGTGAFDEGAGLSLSIIKGFTRYFARGSYILREDSTYYQTRNYLSYALGITYLLSFDLQASLLVNGATPPLADASPPCEAQIRMGYRISQKLRLSGSLGYGLSDGSPDITGSIAVIRTFR